MHRRAVELLAARDFLAQHLELQPRVFGCSELQLGRRKALCGVGKCLGIARVQAGMTSSSYTSGPLSKAEVCLAAFARRLREAIPEAIAVRDHN